MADPRTVNVLERATVNDKIVNRGGKAVNPNLSPLMVAKGLQETGEKANFCPFGCSDDELDDHGYCYHLVGFTNDGKKYEPMVCGSDGNLVVQVPFKTQRLGPRKIKKIYEYGKVEKTDVLRRITTSARVYRDVPRPEGWDARDEFLGDDEEVPEDASEETEE